MFRTHVPVQQLCHRCIAHAFCYHAQQGGSSLSVDIQVPVVFPSYPLPDEHPQIELELLSCVYHGKGHISLTSVLSEQRSWGMQEADRAAAQKEEKQRAYEATGIPDAMPSRSHTPAYASKPRWYCTFCRFLRSCDGMTGVLHTQLAISSCLAGAEAALYMQSQGGA